MPVSFSNPTLVDALVVVLVGLYVLEDVRRGILYGLVQLAGLLLALFAALLLYPSIAGELVGRLDVGYGLAKPLAFGGIWLLSDLLYTVTIRQFTAGPTDEVARSTLGRL